MENRCYYDLRAQDLPTYLPTAASAASGRAQDLPTYLQGARGLRPRDLPTYLPTRPTHLPLDLPTQLECNGRNGP